MLDDARSIPHLLQRATRRWGPAIAMRHRKDLARWGIITWSELNHHVSEVAAGLVDLGLRRGDRVALFSATRSDWSICDYGVLTVGAVSVPVYHTSTTGQLTYIVNNCNARFLIVDNEARLAQVLEARERMRGVERVIVMDRLDLRGREDTSTLADLIRRGRRHLRRNPDLPRRRLADLTPDDEATYVYTSGTTGMPKGVVLTHGNLLAAVGGLSGALGVTDEDVTVLFLPLSHIYGRIGQFLALATGVSTAYAQRIDRLEEVFVEVKPTFVFGVPLVYERIYRSIARRFRELSPLRKKLYHRALESGLGRVRSAAAGRTAVAGPGSRRDRVPGAAGELRRPAPLRHLRGRATSPLGGGVLPGRRDRDPGGIRAHRDCGSGNPEPAHREPDRLGGTADPRGEDSHRRGRRGVDPGTERIRRLPRTPGRYGGLLHR